MKKYILFNLALCIVFTFLSINQAVFSQDLKKDLEKVDVMPEYPGGNDALIKAIVNEIKYPEEAKKEGIEGKVLIEFVVDMQGNVSDTKVLKGVGQGCDEEALRVVKMLKPFKPGVNNGMPVNVKMVIPIAFKLEEKDK